MEKITKGLLNPDKAEKYRSIDTSRLSFCQEGWTGATSYLRFLGFQPQDDNRRKYVLATKDEHQKIISRGLAFVQLAIKGATPSKRTKQIRNARRNPPKREMQIYNSGKNVSGLKRPGPSSRKGKTNTKLIMDAYAEGRARKAAEFPQMFVTRQRREEEKEKRRRKYAKTLIRVMFSGSETTDNVVIQGYFSSHETPLELFIFISKCLRTEKVISDFYFHLPPTTKLNKDDNQKTLEELGLVPAAVLYFKCKDGKNSPKACILDDIYSSRQDQEVIPIIPKAINEREVMHLRQVDQGMSKAYQNLAVDDKSESDKQSAAMLKKYGFDDL